MSSSSQLKHIGADTFSPLKSLKFFHCSFNPQLKSIHPDAFRGMKNKRDFSLSEVKSIHPVVLDVVMSRSFPVLLSGQRRFVDTARATTMGPCQRDRYPTQSFYLRQLHRPHDPHNNSLHREDTPTGVEPHVTLPSLHFIALSIFLKRLTIGDIKCNNQNASIPNFDLTRFCCRCWGPAAHKGKSLMDFFHDENTYLNPIQKDPMDVVKETRVAEVDLKRIIWTSNFRAGILVVSLFGIFLIIGIVACMGLKKDGRKRLFYQTPTRIVHYFRAPSDSRHRRVEVGSFSRDTNETLLIDF